MKSLSVDTFEVFLCTRFGWMRVRALKEALAMLLMIMRRRAVGPIAFKRILNRAVQHKIAEFQYYASLPGRASIIPVGFMELLADLATFLGARSNSSWRAIMDQGRSLIPKITLCDSPGPMDYAMSVAQLMCLGSRINLMGGGGAARPSFCKLCWRINLVEQVCCPVHSASKKPSGAGSTAADLLDLARKGDSYFFSRRLQPLFTEALIELERLDRAHRVRSRLQRAIREGCSLDWLEKYRPHVFAAFGRSLREVPADGSFLEWFELMDCVPNESEGKRNERGALHRVLSHDRTTLFKVLQRAEAWLTAAHIRRKRWGGRRSGAGRKLSHAAEAYSSGARAFANMRATGVRR